MLVVMVTGTPILVALRSTEVTVIGSNYVMAMMKSFLP